MNVRIGCLMAMVLGCAALDAARADDEFRCGNTLVKPGMTRTEVQKLCGAPTSTAEEVQDVLSAGRVVGKTSVNRWTYTSYSKTRVLVFDQDVLKMIESE